jgi:hypothetical protein
VHAGASLEEPSATDMRLRGWQLVVARTLVLAIMITINGLHVLALPGLVGHLATPCADAVNITGPERCLLTPELVAPLTRLGLTPVGVALVVVALSYLTLLLVDAVATVLLLRRSDDWMALLVALTLILLPLPFTPVRHWLSSGWEALVQALGISGWALFVLVLGLFPSGHFVPRWLWAPVSATLLVTPGIDPTLIAGLHVSDTVMNALVTLWELVTVSTVLILIAGQTYRYRRVSTTVQRQQTKWAVFGLVISLMVLLLYVLPFVWTPALSRPEALFIVLRYPDGVLMICILAVAFGVAILRSRLFDIDVIIRRTLVYGTLTAILAAVYFGVVIGAQSVVQALTHQTNPQPAIIVASTLLIAALFNPLRHRLQAVIDRRFYRRKYDAAKTLAAFGTTLRTETDLGELSEHLVAVVQETMQPASVSLWLRKPEKPAGTGSALASRSIMSERAPHRAISQEDAR